MSHLHEPHFVYAILGLLNWQPLSGYDLKKIISGSDVFYWSGNNNQIYRTLVQMHADGLVSQEIQVQENLPAKKIYSITASGQETLQRWILSEPELPELHSTFLMQLAWAGQMNGQAVEILLGKYEEEVEARVFLLQGQKHRERPVPAHTDRERFLWEKIFENITSLYQNELVWVRQVRKEYKEKGYF